MSVNERCTFRFVEPSSRIPAFPLRDSFICDTSRETDDCEDESFTPESSYIGREGKDGISAPLASQSCIRLHIRDGVSACRAIM